MRRGRGRWTPAGGANSGDSLDLFLRDLPTDEKGGVDGTLGFTYQQWWAALTSLELLEQGSDFAVGLEVKEDVCILDSALVPTTVEFCQVKKNESAGAWQLKNLHKPEKNKDGANKPSTLAKLYRRRHEFVGHTTRLRFVSNVAFKVPAADDSVVSSKDTRLELLTPTQQQQVKDAIAAQLGIGAHEVDLKDLRLHVSDLPLQRPIYYLSGKIMALCQSGSIPFPVTKPDVAAAVLAVEIQQRASNTSYATDFEQLKSRILSKKDALAALSKVAQAPKTPFEVLEECIQRLNSEGFAYLAVEAIRSARVQVCTDAADRSNTKFGQVAARMHSLREAAISACPAEAQLGTLMKQLVELSAASNPIGHKGLHAGYLDAVALLVMKNALTDYIPSSSADTKPEAEQ